ncbi:apolipoprotein N-acyltransferase [Actinoplanes couchii]|uniref:Apolipoprotein N-acyltransferase n=2 Tax=Actinoplanes couchii TaxID=403638 RepID=A0ABQ3X1W0_9ACTN|nr:apolipoprotein N-acyltransferase [Actinoplanes couchii]GID52504.1 apolipoprotein N-acyltransferase [Actinoplanes couchii]
MEMTLPPPALAEPGSAPPGGSRRPLRLPVAAALAVAAGAALLLALPPFDLWWLSPAGVALLAAAVHRRRLRAGFGLGMLAGLVLFVPLLEWTTIGAGWLPWIILAVLQSLYIGLAGLAGAWVSPLVDRWRALWPLLAGLIWTTQEFLRDRTPFGGFPWGRIAFSQGDSPTLRLAAYGGAPLVTFVVTVAGGALVALFWRRSGVLGAAGFAVVVAVLLGGPAALPLTATTGPSTTVAIVQGNVPRLGLDFNAQRRAVLDNHVKATVQLAADVASGKQKQPSLVVWPENSSDIDPLRNSDAGEQIQYAADTVKAPILVGTLQRTDVPRDNYNVGILWNPGTGPDLAQQYAKRHPVPFAEYMPLRSIARVVSERADLVSNMLAGDHPGVIDTGAVTVGDVICFEVAYDGLVKDVVDGGAQILTVQTNNATFNEAEALQQLAMVQLRAVEHGREGLMVSTVGVSAFVDAEGTVHGSTGFNTAAVVVRDMKLDGPRTLATRSGNRPEVVLVVATVIALVGVLPLRRWRDSIDGDSVKVSEEQ